MSRYKIVMVRHGESEWNQLNLLCGWYNSKLSKKGEIDASSCGQTLKDNKFKFDLAFTSVLKRAQDTLSIILKILGQTNIPITTSWRLNERHFGVLTGLTKIEAAKKYGEEQVEIWCRSYDIPPPPMEKDHQYYRQIIEDPCHKDGPSPKEFPKFESLKLTLLRMLPFWYGTAIPEIRNNKLILIVAHDNSLRVIIKHLEHIPDNDIMRFVLPNAIPFVYTLDDCVKPVTGSTIQFLGDPEIVQKAIAAIVAQEKVKK